MLCNWKAIDFTDDLKKKYNLDFLHNKLKKKK